MSSSSSLNVHPDFRYLAPCQAEDLKQDPDAHHVFTMPQPAAFTSETWQYHNKVLENTGRVAQDPNFLPQEHSAKPVPRKIWPPMVPFEVFFYTPGQQGRDPSLGIKAVDLYRASNDNFRTISPESVLLHADKKVPKPFEFHHKTARLVAQWPGYNTVLPMMVHIHFADDFTLMQVALKILKELRLLLAKARTQKMLKNADGTWKVGPGNVTLDQVGFSRLWSANGEVCCVDIYTVRS